MKKQLTILIENIMGDFRVGMKIDNNIFYKTEKHKTIKSAIKHANELYADITGDWFWDCYNIVKGYSEE